MSNRKKLSLIFIGMLLFLPFLGQNASGATSLGNVSIIASDGDWVVWKVTYVIAPSQQVNIGDKYNTTFREVSSTGGDLFTLNATFKIYNSTSGLWGMVSETPCFSYNSTSGNFSFFDPYVQFPCFVFPANITLDKLGMDLVWSVDHCISYEIDGNDLKFTYGYGSYINLIRMRSDGIVSLYELRSNADVCYYRAVLSDSSLPLGGNDAIPFVGEYLIFIALSTFGLIIVVRRKTTLNT